MSLDREAIYAGIFGRLQTLTGSAGVITCSRRLKAWTDVPPSAQPAVFLREGTAVAEVRIGEPSIWKLKAEVYVYATDASAAGPVTKLNQLVKAVDDLLQPPPSGDPTLGGLVLYATPASVETDEGLLGDQGVAVIEIEIAAAG